MNINYLENVKRLIAEQACIAEKSITPEDRLVEDLGMDSLDFIELIMEIEDGYGIDVTEDDIKHIKLVSEVVDVLEKILTGEKPSKHVVPAVVESEDELRGRSMPLVWYPGPANGGGGTAQEEHPEGRSHWWWDGDLLLVIVTTSEGPFVRLVHVSADGDQLSFDDPDTGDDNFGYGSEDISWWARVMESVPKDTSNPIV